MINVMVKYTRRATRTTKIMMLAFRRLFPSVMSLCFPFAEVKLMVPTIPIITAAERLRR
jgi:hypothetical protein